jgi:hypothetical protein
LAFTWVNSTPGLFSAARAGAKALPRSVTRPNRAGRKAWANEEAETERKAEVFIGFLQKKGERLGIDAPGKAGAGQ